MNSELLPYYERELLFIRQMAADFAEQYPDRAAALKLDGSGSEDPHVERLVESFALIAGRIQRKIEDEFPEITEALLDVLYPHYLRPIPSMAIAQFEADPEQGNLSSGYVVPRGGSLYSSPVGGTVCRFRTAYPVHLWPSKSSRRGSRNRASWHWAQPPRTHHTPCDWSSGVSVESTSPSQRFRISGSI